jgi:hypothetical protein
MTTTIIKNTNIKELLEVSAGNFEVLERMTQEFRQKVQEPFKKTARLAGQPQIILKSSTGIRIVSVSAEAYRRGHRIIITIE